MRIDVHTDTRTFAGLKPAWDRLAARGGIGLFAGFSGRLGWWRARGPGRALRLGGARGGEGVRGLLPLYEEERDGVKRLAFVASAGGGADFLEPVTDDPHVRERLLGAVST